MVQGLLVQGVRGSRCVSVDYFIPMPRWLGGVVEPPLCILDGFSFYSFCHLRPFETPPLHPRQMRRIVHCVIPFTVFLLMSDPGLRSNLPR
jgi:hypothetical protein